ncbi:MAG TPA: hypothetical protein VHB02_09515 [Acidimicrobiales bacterium]|nr:hypothetical protein [Acidimicrobiales bacterium]
MPTVTVSRTDVTPDEVVAALNDRLGAKYTVEPKEGHPDVIHVELSLMSTCRVHLVPEATATKLHVHGGGIIIGRIVNELGIANRVARALRDANLDRPPTA